jgi:hypothetical protein
MKIFDTIKSTFIDTGKIKWIDINEIKIDPEIKGIFIQKESDIEHIASEMRIDGFNPAFPIILAKSKTCPELNKINADGNTRYEAAKRAKINKIPVIFQEFSSREELVMFVYKRSLLRRNLTESEVFKSWMTLHALMTKEGKKAKSDEEIAHDLSVSRRQVSKMKEVSRKASPETLEGVKTGTLSLNKAYSQIKASEVKNTSTNKAKNSKDYQKGYEEGFILARDYCLWAIENAKSFKEIKDDLDALHTGNKTLEEVYGNK